MQYSCLEKMVQSQPRRAREIWRDLEFGDKINSSERLDCAASGSVWRIRLLQTACSHGGRGGTPSNPSSTMAPIPSILPPEIQDQISALTRRQKDLFDYQIPRLRTCKGPLVTQQQYAAELREDVEGFARSVEVLESSVDDLKGDRGRRELRVVVEELQGSLARCVVYLCCS